jgi:group II intron reverse transcriptase/maturase
MSDRERVRDFQRKIYQKAKQEKDFRFYVLYDKLMLPHFLREAYKRCKANRGSAGVDGVTFDDIEISGVGDFLKGIANELEKHTYKPQPVLRVNIPKPNGKTRPLGIPTVKDRVIQMAVKLVIEPIFEANFEDSSYGFRPQRSANDAVSEIKSKLKKGKAEIFDADLSAYFDTIPHKELMFLVAQRVSDKHVLHLIKMWLKAPVKENNRLTGGKKKKVGIPQGGVISPLLANIYLHLLDKAVSRMSGKFARYGVEIVRYADDFVLMGRHIPAKVLEYLISMLGRMKLSLNAGKSSLVNGYKESFDFLGFTFRYSNGIHSRETKYWNVEPSKKSQQKIRSHIREYLRYNGHKCPELLAADLNSIMRGWINYFSINGVSYPAKAKRKLRYYLFEKLNSFYKRKSQRKSKLYTKGALDYLVKHYGLIDPAKYSTCRYTVKA